MSKGSTASAKTPTPLPSQSAWARGPPQNSNSSAPSSRSQFPAPSHVQSITASHSRRPSALGQGVPVKEGISVPRNTVGSVRQGSSLNFGSIDDASAPVSSSPTATPVVRHESVKTFGSLPVTTATTSNIINGKTPASGPSAGSSKPSSRPSAMAPSISSSPSATASPSSTTSATTSSTAPASAPNSTPSTSLAATPSSSSPSTSIESSFNIAKLFQGNPSASEPSSGATSPSSPPMPVPVHWSPYYYLEYQSPQWFYPMQPVHGMGHASHAPEPTPQGHSHSGLPSSPRTQPLSLSPSTPTMAHAVPDSPRTPQPPPPQTQQLSASKSISLPPPTSSTSIASGGRSLDTDASTIVPAAPRSDNITIICEDGIEVKLESFKKPSPQPSTPLMPPPPPITTSRLSASGRVENQWAKWIRKREAKRQRQEETEADTQKEHGIIESPTRESLEVAQDEMIENGKVFESYANGASKISRSQNESLRIDTSEFARRRPDPLDTNPNKVGLVEHGPGAASPVPALELAATLEMSTNRWVSGSAQRRGATDVGTSKAVDRKVKSLLNKLTMETFDSISDRIIAWANKSENEKDGRTLIQVIRLVFEKATDEADRSEVYARLCRKTMETISPKVQDDGIKSTDGKPIAGGQLFRKYLLNQCQEDFERGWVAKEATAHAAAAKANGDETVEAANEKKGHENELYSDEYYAAQKARRQGLGLIKFIGQLFKLQMLTERVIHECVKKLLGNVENPEEEEIEGLCQLLRNVGQLLDVPKARAQMDVYFQRMRELCKNPNISPRIQLMLQDVIELRDRKWQSHNVVDVPTTLADTTDTKLPCEQPFPMSEGAHSASIGGDPASLLSRPRFARNPGQGGSSGHQMSGCRLCSTCGEKSKVGETDVVTSPMPVTVNLNVDDPVHVLHGRSVPEVPTMQPPPKSPPTNTDIPAESMLLSAVQQMSYKPSFDQMVSYLVIPFGLPHSRTLMLLGSFAVRLHSCVMLYHAGVVYRLLMIALYL
ncbi:hypothetical protein BKA82DRAFT_913438 [Pisolithus tinctorius]|uniref:MIF4G domain-containing protein n=1 Tax=Pisolithus tinctorius Marx 270 TaxID=870435 RepID=A0A0C3KLR5_PISTI|nr:hypothetical protein BKA82DRAFT_913438 [Pisolithus tinctorius]KIO10547.1 hypothetical protein M404DRAFT_913438 [Pisolithus tinctorius Marx 270]